jgi:hypothetical protein
VLVVLVLLAVVVYKVQTELIPLFLEAESQLLLLQEAVEVVEMAVALFQMEILAALAVVLEIILVQLEVLELLIKDLLAVTTQPTMVQLGAVVEVLVQ